MTTKTKTTTSNNRATVTLKFLKTANYESKLFKVVEVNKDHQLLNKFIKSWEGTKMMYLKEKYLNEKHNPLSLGSYYRVQLSFEEFTNNDGKDIVFINKIRYKAVEFEEKVMMNSDDESDY
jgi:hypothetical protein